MRPGTNCQSSFTPFDDCAPHVYNSAFVNFMNGA
jgi:hypothetical protein